MSTPRRVRTHLWAVQKRPRRGKGHSWRLATRTRCTDWPAVFATRKYARHEAAYLQRERDGENIRYRVVKIQVEMPA